MSQNPDYPFNKPHIIKIVLLSLTEGDIVVSTRI